ncbi:T-complex protein 1 subunit theta [Nematocida homosporus]|uniref:T-complex protein 1 subunit theta n=1 Tax=Nematocida homosporus TaxID=1912981 RepID=UPI002220F0C6|nr:T-complex protein 1 subunit theta [Nematocida homosporus]KAI5184798.1 T-complex protein 1 subunit theta [Nematocida homosporus]
MVFGSNSLMKTKSVEMSGINCVLKNIDGIIGICDMLQSSYGADGMYKLVVNAHQKTIISRSVASILSGCDIEHPALRMLVEPVAHLAQLGDCTGFFMGVLGEVLKKSALLIEQQVLPTEIASGLRDTLADLSEVFDKVSEKVEFSLTDKDVLAKVTSGILKEGKLADLLSEAIAGISKNGSFALDSVRVTKVDTGSMEDSERLPGMLLEIAPAGTVEMGQNLKTAIYTCPLAMSNLETKGTVLFKNAEELANYARDDESTASEFVDSITANGVGLLVCSGSVDPLLLDFLNAKGVAVLSVHSKFDLRRLCLLFGGRFSHTMRPMEPEFLGVCNSLEICTYGDRRYTKITGPGRVNTLVVRGSLPARLEESERLIGKATYALQTCANESMRTGKLRLLAGAGKGEELLAAQIKQVVADKSDAQKIAGGVIADAMKTVGARCQAPDYPVYDIAAIKQRALEYALILAADILSVTQMFITKNEDALQAPKRPGHWDDYD